MIKTCKFCNKEFNGRKERLYCSSRCQHDSLVKSRITKTCECCGKEFDVVKENKNTINQRFCSLNCNYIFSRKKIRLECPICKAEFFRKPSEIKNTNCCSVSCSSKLTMNQTGTSSQRKLTRIFETLLNEDAIEEATFQELKFKRNLRVDALFKNNRLALEFNGKQHYEEKSSFDYKIDFKESVSKDNIKIKFLLENNFNVVEWPFYVSISKKNVMSVLAQMTNQQPSSSNYFIVDEKVQRLDGDDVNQISHPRVPDILNLRDDDIVRSYVKCEIFRSKEIKSSLN